MTSYRGNEAIDWFGFSQLWSQTVGYAVITSRIDSLNRRKTLNKSLASARLLFCGKGDGVKVPHLAASEIVINNFMVSGLASRSITDNAGWHTQNTQIFYPAILTYEKLYGILFLIKIEIIKGKPAERQGHKARSD